MNSVKKKNVIEMRRGITIGMISTSILLFSILVLFLIYIEIGKYMNPYFYIIGWFLIGYIGLRLSEYILYKIVPPLIKNRFKTMPKGYWEDIKNV